MTPSFSGQCLSATCHLTNQNYVWPIKQSLTSHFNYHYTKPPIETLMNTHATHASLKNKKQIKIELNHPIAYSMVFSTHRDQPLP